MVVGVIKRPGRTLRVYGAGKGKKWGSVDCTLSKPLVMVQRGPRSPQTVKMQHCVALLPKQEIVSCPSTKRLAYLECILVMVQCMSVFQCDTMLVQRVPTQVLPPKLPMQHYDNTPHPCAAMRDDVACLRSSMAPH